MESQINYRNFYQHIVKMREKMYAGSWLTMCMKSKPQQQLLEINP